MLAERRIGFVGAGAMAEALAGGLLASGVAAERLRAADPDPVRRRAFVERLGVEAGGENAAVLRASDLVVLAVKPAVVPAVLAELAAAAPADAARVLWISIAAGVPLDVLAAPLPRGARIVRAMPNTPALVRAGATGFAGNAGASAEDRRAALALFESVGFAWEAPDEALLDAVTGLSGSGPAYLFAFVEALVEAGVAVGLPRGTAEALAKHTAAGAARLALESERSPAELRRQVSSPGGTTLAGLGTLEQHHVRDAIIAAVEAATRRARELAAA